MLTLDVYEGSHRRTVTVDGDVVRVGRDPECEVVLAGDTTVSRVHATLTRTADRVADRGQRQPQRNLRQRTQAGRRARPGICGDVLVGSFVLVRHDSGDEATETVAADAGGRVRAQVETGLSTRELEVLRLLCAGDSDQQIADALYISVKTVQSHLDRIRTKTGARRRAELLRFAMDHGIA